MPTPEPAGSVDRAAKHAAAIDKAGVAVGMAAGRLLGRKHQDE